LANCRIDENIKSKMFCLGPVLWGRFFFGSLSRAGVKKDFGDAFSPRKMVKFEKNQKKFNLGIKYLKNLPIYISENKTERNLL